ncbi:MAG: nickel pincer cofactor biosynthesis protein LarC [Deltaproteobacteria bacterium]|nr:nickel pincer cofactor biosynthesis protein LarC [Deltaproteobacteria bacterium]
MKKNILFFDAFSGIAGDMALGALVDAGVPADYVKETLSSLGLKGYDLSFEKITVKGISGTRFICSVTGKSEPMDYARIRSLISSSGLSGGVKSRTLLIFKIIAEAESGIHGTDLESCHFHEVGAVDSIVDIVGTAAAMFFLKPDEVWCSPLKMGRGFIASMHGKLPLPAPAVLEILKGAPLEPAEEDGEWVTPTGAAIVKACALGFTKFPRMAADKIGYGFGSRENAFSVNALRAVIGFAPEGAEEKNEGGDRDEILIEVNLDDMTPEVVGYLSAKLLAEGALDVWTTPVYMKKNRPAVMLSVIAGFKDLDRFAGMIFRETTTIGLRFNFIGRMKCGYEIEEFESSLGKCRVKKVSFRDSVVTIHPEYEDCVKLSGNSRVPLKDVMDRVRTEYAAKIKNK